MPKLWTGLQGAAAALEIDLDARVKQMLWKQVLHVPRITFLIPNLRESQTVEAGHPSIQLVEEAEKLGVHVVAPEGLRESCLGLYDGKLCDAAISRDQRELLERLAKARFAASTYQFCSFFSVVYCSYLYLLLLMLMLLPMCFNYFSRYVFGGKFPITG